MKKIGFIDYYLDEWHANNYPEMFKKHSEGEFEVCCAYAKIDSPIGGLTSEEWSKEYNIPLCATPGEVTEKCDVIIVLSPDNSEMHEELSDVPLKSGKLVYIDKTFAPTREIAERIFEKADKYGTKCYSASALSFASELDEIDMSDIDAVYSEGPGEFDKYIVHQVEPMVKLMKTPAKRVMYTGMQEHPVAVIEFTDGRMCSITLRSDNCGSFKYTLINKENFAKAVDVKSDTWANFSEAFVKFVRTGEIPVPHERTIEVMAICEALIKAQKNPFEWVSVG